MLQTVDFRVGQNYGERQVWQGSAGDRRPYADLVVYWEAIPLSPSIKVEKSVRLSSGKHFGRQTGSLPIVLSVVLVVDRAAGACKSWYYCLPTTCSRNATMTDGSETHRDGI